MIYLCQLRLLLFLGGIFAINLPPSIQRKLTIYLASLVTEIAAASKLGGPNLPEPSLLKPYCTFGIPNRLVQEKGGERELLHRVVYIDCDLWAHKLDLNSGLKVAKQATGCRGKKDRANL